LRNEAPPAKAALHFGQSIINAAEWGRCQDHRMKKGWIEIGENGK
jgi:hypothetical protein